MSRYLLNGKKRQLRNLGKREIDAQISIHLFGWQWYTHWGCNGKYLFRPNYRPPFWLQGTNEEKPKPLKPLSNQNPESAGDWNVAVPRFCARGRKVLEKLKNMIPDDCRIVTKKYKNTKKWVAKLQKGNKVLMVAKAEERGIVICLLALKVAVRLNYPSHKGMGFPIHRDNLNAFL